MKPDNVNHPSHYADNCSIECFDAMKVALGYEGIVYFCFGNMFKYLWRHKFKNGAEDIKKATWYSAKAVECISEIEDTDFITAGRLSDIGNPLMDILEKADKEYPVEKDCKGNAKDEINRKLNWINANSYYGLFPKDNPTFTFNNRISEETLEKWEELMNETFEVKEKKEDEDKDLDDDLDELLEKLWFDTFNYLYNKEEKNDAKDESPSEAEKTLGVISNIITDCNTSDPVHKIAKIHGVLEVYYREYLGSNS